jgi:glycosyltransferase involved in cell wall biosynthesis
MVLFTAILVGWGNRLTCKSLWGKEMQRILTSDMRSDGQGDRAPERRNGGPSVKVSLIIPTLNEADNLELVLPTIPNIVDELIIMDGGSTDGTVEVVDKLRPTARVIVDPRPGKGNALRRGFEAATGDILIMMDADGSMDVLDIATFVAVLEAGADVAKGSRFLQGGGSADLTTLRHLGNRALTRAVRFAFGGRYSDLCYGYMAFWRHVLPTFEGEVQGFEIETFLNVRALAAGLRVVEVASFENQRIFGDSHLRAFRDGSRVLLTIARERRRLSKARAAQGVPRPIARPAPVEIVTQNPATVTDLFDSPSSQRINEA